MQPVLGRTIYVDLPPISDPTTGSSADPTGLPTVVVYEDGQDEPILAPEVIKRSGTTGEYYVAIAVTTANGFEAYRSYNAVATATVAGVVGKALVVRFVPLATAAVPEPAPGAPAASGALTVARARSILAREVGPVIALVDTDFILARSARQVGVATASPGGLLDAELAGMEATKVDAFFDVAILRALESALANLDARSLQEAGIEDSMLMIAANLREAIRRKEAYVKGTHGIGVAVLGVGAIGLDFAGTMAEAEADEWGAAPWPSG